MNKKVVIIGNSPVGQLLSMMLGDSYEIVRVIDSVREVECVPFYANDIKKGILKQFCTLTQISLHDMGSYKIRIKLMYDKNKELCCESSFESFKSRVEEICPQYKTEINQLFEDIKDIGEEWSTFLQNNFDSSVCKMKKSAKYASITVDKYLKTRGIYEADINKIFHTILPIHDVTFPVFAGYLYTQFFDNNILDKNMWREISANVDSCGKSILLKDISNVVVEEDRGDFSPVIQNKIDCVVDLRFKDVVDKQADNTNKWVWGGFFSTDDIDENMIYSLRISEEAHLRFWKSLYEPERAGKRWQFELLTEKNVNLSSLKVLKLVSETIRERLGVEIEMKSDSIYDPSYFENKFDCPYGYMWAFNLKQSMKDPTNLFVKQSSPNIKSGYWGFAWFSEAFCLYNAISKQVEWKGMYRIIH